LVIPKLFRCAPSHCGENVTLGTAAKLRRECGSDNSGNH
jgi:hypothetical protein